MRYPTILSRVAIFLWSMTFSTLGFGQLTFEEVAGADDVFSIDIDDLPDNPVVGPPAFLSDKPQPLDPIIPPEEWQWPYYDVFMIYGDGNFERHEYGVYADHVPPPVSGNFNHNYVYRNNYPAIALLTARKSDTPPQPTRRQNALPGSSPGVIVISTPASGPPANNMVYMNPTNNIIPVGGLVGIGFSQRDNIGHFILNNHLVAAPIAYKPNARGVLVLYYNNANDEHLVYGPASEVPFGTYFSSYLPGANNAVRNAEDVRITPDAAPLELGLFHSKIEYNIHEGEENFYAANEELRVIPIFKSNDLNGNHQLFLATMYTEADLNEFNYIERDKKNILGGLGDELPESINVDTVTLYFQDAFLRPVERRDPNDPNKLRITGICNCNGDYIVEFKLEFCNKSEFADATGATIILRDIGREDGVVKVFNNCIELDGVNPGSECCYADCCNQNFEKINESQELERYCVRFQPGDYLETNECGTITFSAKMSPSDINLLWQKPVLEYCVLLHSGVCNSSNSESLDIHKDNKQPLQTTSDPDSRFFHHFFKEVCGVNRVLKKYRVRQKDPQSNPNNPKQRLGPFFMLESAEIWKNKDDECECINCCKGSFKCIISYYRKAALPLGIVVFGLIAWFFIRRRKVRINKT